MYRKLPGWSAVDVASSSDWRIPYAADSESLAESLRKRLDQPPGFALVADVPVTGMTPEEGAGFAPELLGALGRPRLQGPPDSSTFGWVVRDEGSSRYLPDGRFTAGVYTSKSHDELDIHNDSAMSAYREEIDYFALLCFGSAEAGGQSLLLSVPTVIEHLERDFPDALERLRQPFAIERGHVAHAGDPWIWAPVFDDRPEGLRVRCNRQRIEMAPALTKQPLTEFDVAALDALDAVMTRPNLQFRLDLDPGDLLVANDHLILHARDAFRDNPAAGRRRCLIRVLLDRHERRKE